MALSKWMTQLHKKEYAVKGDYNPFAHVIRSGSPSFDYIYGNTHGMPLGYSEILWGPPKGGKSISTYAKAGQLHRDDPDAIVVKFNTEMREEGQLSKKSMRNWGIDPDRYIAYNTNRPDEIFDYVETELAKLCQDGAPIRYIIIDSITEVLGRRAMNADSVMTQQIGDDAKTVQDGLKRIRAVLRRNRIGLSMVAQARAELDPLEQMRGNKLKMAGAWYLQHFAEYFVLVEPNRSKAGKTDLSGNEFIDESKTDLMGHGEKTAHKIRVTMKDSSCGPKGRVGEYTLDYHEGFINKHEEIFQLGVGQGVVIRPNQTSYIVPNWPEQGKESKYVGKENFLQALKQDTYMQAEIGKRVRLQDIDAMENGRAQKAPETSED